MRFARRRLLMASGAMLAVACGPTSIADRPTPEPTGVLPDLDAWNQEARGMLSDAIQALRTYDTYQAFRVSTASQSGARLASELAWDPPTSSAWDEATHVSRGLHGRADILFRAIAVARVDASAWRQQRSMADASHTLLDLGDALAAYRDRVDVLPPGDAGQALSLLDKAWAQYDTSAAAWGLSRAESIGCA